MNDEYYGQFWAAIAAERIRDYDTNLGDTKRDL